MLYITIFLILVQLIITVDYNIYSIVKSFDLDSNNNELLMVNILRLVKANTKTVSQSGIIDMLRNSNYSSNDMIPEKSERDALIRIMFNQLTPTQLSINNVIFIIKEINTTNGFIISSHGPINCFIIKAGNFLLYIAGVGIKWEDVSLQQIEAIEILKKINSQQNNYIIF